MSGSLRIDLHVHSTHSPDSRLPLDSIPDLLGPRGLTGFALTDHNTIAGHSRLKELAREYPRYLLVPGVEVSTAHGHLLALGVDAVPPKDRPLPETIDWIRAHGGVSILAHPFRRVHGAGAHWALEAKVDGLETVNGHNLAVPNARAEVIAVKRGLSGTGGSDSHSATTVGRAFTQFSEEPSTVDDLLTSLQKARGEGAGRSLTRVEWVRQAWTNGIRRAGRRFRPI
jgi:predicted metal-dependent phosphoesterase TrpH